MDHIKETSTWLEIVLQQDKAGTSSGDFPVNRAVLSSGMAHVWCGRAAGGSWEAGRGGTALVFSWIPILLETCGLLGVRILQAGRAGAPAPCFGCSVVLGASSAGHRGSHGGRGLVTGEKSWAEMGSN